MCKTLTQGALAVWMILGGGCGSSEQPTTPADGWGYLGDIGPAHWAALSPSNAACGNGQLQSPIDLTNPSLQAAVGDLLLDYVVPSAQLANTGHTLQVNFPGGNLLHVGQTTYELQQFHVHTPSEHLVNGSPAQAELHLVHKSSDGQLAVVAVLLQQGVPNDPLARMLDSAPGKQMMGSTAQPIAPVDLIPAGSGYYTYMGSLTTPPCTEGVLWLVLDKTGKVDTAQVAQFQSLFGANARPTQTRDGRPIDEYTAL